MKKLLLIVISTILCLDNAKAGEKRWYRMSASGPTITEKEDGTRELRWKIKTDTRFDGPDGSYVNLDTRPHLKRITGAPRLQKLQPDWFKHKDRKSDGDPKREIKLGGYVWECLIGVLHRDGRFDKRKTVQIETRTNSKPDAKAIDEVRRSGITEEGTTYKLTLISTPANSGVVRYYESIRGFSGQSFAAGFWNNLWHFNKGRFNTEVLVRGVPRT